MISADISSASGPATICQVGVLATGFAIFIDKTSMGPAPVYFPPETAWYEMGPQRPKKDQEPWNLNKKCPLTVCFIYNFPGYTINKDGHREPKNETPIDPVPEFNAGGAEVAWNHI